MAKAGTRGRTDGPTPADQVLDLPEASVLDVLDHVLTKGVLASGDVTLGVAGIDLIYLRLSAILCAADRVLPGNDPMVASRQRKVRVTAVAKAPARRAEAPSATAGARRRKPAATSARRRKADAMPAGRKTRR
jgi:hypothetical protein